MILITITIAIIMNISITGWWQYYHLRKSIQLVNNRRINLLLVLNLMYDILGCVNFKFFDF